MVANPRVMRDMPHLLRDAGLQLLAAEGALYADIGGGSVWPNAADAYSAVLARSGEVPVAVVDDWRVLPSGAVREATFSGASAY